VRCAARSVRRRAFEGRHGAIIRADAGRRKRWCSNDVAPLDTATPCL
jgi:hypothetical protein